MVSWAVFSKRSFIEAIGAAFPITAMTTSLILAGVPRLAIAQNVGPQRWERQLHSQQLRVPTGPNTVQTAPPEIPRFDVSSDSSGALATFQPGGTTITSTNPFFQNLGTNGRTCFTCHQGKTGWTVSAASVRQRFADSNGTDPIFRLVDGATCSTDDVSTLAAKQQAYGLLLSKGLIRIALPLPASSVLHSRWSR